MFVNTEEHRLLARAYLAYTKSGGSIEEMKRKVEELGVSTETLRSKMANILENRDKRVRRGEQKTSDQPGDRGCSQEGATGASQHYNISFKNI